MSGSDREGLNDDKLVRALVSFNLMHFVMKLVVVSLAPKGHGGRYFLALPVKDTNVFGETVFDCFDQLMMSFADVVTRRRR